MLTKQLYVLKATESTIPATKKHTTRMMSAHLGSTSAVNLALSLVGQERVEHGKSASGVRMPSFSARLVDGSDAICI